jgi:hypothetical protein
MLHRGRVVDARWQQVGQEHGFASQVGRVELRYDGGDGDKPATLIAKLPSMDGDERYEREERFYREIAAAFAPRLYHSVADDARRRVVLLLEDVGGRRQGDVLRGCSIGDAALVLEALALFHARWWGERAVFPRLGRDPEERQARYRSQAARFVEGGGGGLPREACDIVERLGSRLGAVSAELDSARRTLIHGDLHLDNVIFGAPGEGRPVVVLDWQTVAVGPPAWDVVLFLFGSLAVEDRRAAEGELLDLYRTALLAHGVRGYSAADLRRECRLALLVLLAGVVGWVTKPDRDGATDRERALKEAALGDGRLVAALLDHQVEELLAEPPPV